MNNAEVDLLNDYTRFSEIKSVKFFADPRIVDLKVQEDSFEMNVDLSNVGKIGNQEFAIALFEYTPCDNWSGFLKRSIFLSLILSAVEILGRCNWKSKMIYEIR